MKIILSFHENNSLKEVGLYDHTLRNIDELLLFSYLIYGFQDYRILRKRLSK